jgi:hypothetical protein
MTASDADQIDVQHLCRIAGLSRASYYRRFEARAPREADVELTSHIQALSLRYRFYGYRRITAELRRSGIVVNAKRIRRLMREDNLIAVRRKPFAPPTSDSRHGFLIVPNLLRGLVPLGPDQIWVADITYVRLREAFAYLAIHSRWLLAQSGGVGPGSVSRCLARRGSARSRPCRSEAQASQSHSSF